MKEVKYCKECGCYIPDDWEKCPACGFEFHNPFGNLHPAEIPIEICKSKSKIQNPIPKSKIEICISDI